MHLDGWQIVAAVGLAAFLQGVVAVGENQRQQLSLWMAQDQLGFRYPLQGNNVLPEGTSGQCTSLLRSVVTPPDSGPKLPTCRPGDSVFWPLSPGCFESSAEAQPESEGMNQDRDGWASGTLQG